MHGASTELLLIEDDLAVAKSLGRLLAQKGYHVRAVSNCAAARTAGNFSGAVCDLDLPDGHGTELVEELLDHANIKFAVFFTASREPQALRRAFSLGQVVYKSEPVERLLEALARVAGNEKSPLPERHRSGFQTKAGPPKITRKANQ